MPFDPTDYGSGSSVVLDLDFNNTTTTRNNAGTSALDGEAIRYADDLSSASNDLEQTGATARPLLQTATTPASLSSAEFDGTNDQFNIPDKDLIRNVAGFTILIVHKFVDTDSFQFLTRFPDPAANHRFGLSIDGGGQLALFSRQNDAGSTVSINTGASVYTDGEWHVTVGVVDFTNAESQIQNENGILAARQSNGDTTGNTSDTAGIEDGSIMAGDPFGTDIGEGNIARLSLWNEALSVGDVTLAIAQAEADYLTGASPGALTANLDVQSMAMTFFSSGIPAIPASTMNDFDNHNSAGLITETLGHYEGGNNWSYTDSAANTGWNNGSGDGIHVWEDLGWYYDGTRACFQLYDWTGNTVFQTAARDFFNNHYHPFIQSGNGTTLGNRYHAEGLQMLYERDGNINALADLRLMEAGNPWRVAGGDTFDGQLYDGTSVKLTATPGDSPQVGEDVTGQTSGAVYRVNYYGGGDTIYLHSQGVAGGGPYTVGETVTWPGGSGVVDEDWTIVPTGGEAPDITNSRETAYLIDIYIALQNLGDPEPTHWAKAIAGLSNHLTEWSASGARYYFPFQMGLTMETAIRLYNFSGDTDISGIPDKVKGMCDQIWLHWDANEGGFDYHFPPAEPGEPQGAQPSLNMLVVSSFMWVADHFSEDIYRQRADDIFEGGVAFFADRKTNEGNSWTFWSGKDASQNRKDPFTFLNLRSQYSGQGLEGQIGPPAGPSPLITNLSELDASMSLVAGMSGNITGGQLPPGSGAARAVFLNHQLAHKGFVR